MLYKGRYDGMQQDRWTQWMAILLAFVFQGGNCSRPQTVRTFRSVGSNSLFAFRSSPSPLRDLHSSTQQRLFHGTPTLSLNRFLFDPEEVEHYDAVADPPTVVLAKDDYRTVHAATILKVQNGDVIRAGIVGGYVDSHSAAGQYTDSATIEWIPEPPIKKALILANGKAPGPLKVTLPNLVTAHPDDDAMPVSLILALPRPLQLGRILPMIAQLGVEQLVLTSAHKVPKDYFGSHLFRKPQVLREKLIEGLCQSGDVVLPKVTVVKNIRQFLEEDLDALFPLESYARVIAHPERKHDDQPAPLRMRQVQFPNVKNKHAPSKIVVAVGPEGGWTEPEELDLFSDASFQKVTMGARTLRTDCAVVGLMSLAHEVCYERDSDRKTAS